MSAYTDYMKIIRTQCQCYMQLNSNRRDNIFYHRLESTYLCDGKSIKSKCGDMS